MPSSPNNSGPPKSIFGGKFVLKQRLGKGGFGEVFEALQTSTDELVAVKMEVNSGAQSFLFHEARVMQEIQQYPTRDGMPAIGTLKYFGQEGNYRMLIMALHGSSLEDLHARLRRFSLRTTVLLGVQMLDRIEHVHRAGFVHRDLKPDNFVVGRGDAASRIFLIDFGLSARFRKTDGRHLPERTDRRFVGTFRYASMRTHFGHLQSRRDDIEQLVYVLIFLYRGRLPWSGLNITDNDEKERRIGRMKQSLSLEEICVNCPEEFQLLLNYAREMLYDEEPNYENCRVLLLSLAQRGSDFPDVDPYDWRATQAAPVRRPDPIVGGGANNDVRPNSPNEGMLPAIMSKTQGRGVFSGFGSEGDQLNIRSIGDKE